MAHRKGPASDLSAAAKCANSSKTLLYAPRVRSWPLHLAHRTVGSGSMILYALVDEIFRASDATQPKVLGTACRASAGQRLGCVMLCATPRTFSSSFSCSLFGKNFYVCSAHPSDWTSSG